MVAPVVEPRRAIIDAVVLTFLIAEQAQQFIFSKWRIFRHSTIHRQYTQFRQKTTIPKASSKIPSSNSCALKTMESIDELGFEWLGWEHST